MPTPKKTKKPSNTAEIVKQLEQLNESIDDLYILVEKVGKRAGKRRVLDGLVNGLLNAIGIFIGTAVIFAVLFYAGKQFVQSGALQAIIQDAVEDSISAAVPDSIEAFF